MTEWEAYFDLIAARQSCRRFDPARPAEREKLVRCVEAARLAPSACNSQPWRFHCGGHARAVRGAAAVRAAARHEPALRTNAGVQSW